MTAIRESARAKVNLSLRVCGRLSDGYHALESLVVFAGFGDRLTAERADGIACELSGPFGAALEGEASENLVLRAADVLRAEAGRPELGARLALEKNLPVASGLGGGSADAAAALRALDRLWKLDLPAVTLHRIARALGADVPACLDGKAVMMSGVGERLAPVSALPSFSLVLANPRVPVPTGPVFRALGAPALDAMPPPPAVPRFETLDDLTVWLAAHGNDLQAPALRFAPEIEETLDALRHTAGCLLARMSGSGASCFGLYEAEGEAREAADRLAAAHPGWWAVAAPTGTDGGVVSTPG